MIGFYLELFRAENIAGLDNCCSLLQRKISPNIAEDLLRPYNKEEVLHALHVMSPTKSSGPDGFSALFY